METFVKTLQPAEIKSRRLCIPMDARTLFPSEGGHLNVKDATTGREYETIMGSQYRLLIGDWYDERPGIRAGDTITFRKNNGIMMVSLQPDRKVVQANKSAADKLPAIKKKVIDLIVDAFAQIETGGLAARVTVRDTGISVEWGDNIKSTEITFCNTKGTI